MSNSALHCMGEETGSSSGTASNTPDLNLPDSWSTECRGSERERHRGREKEIFYRKTISLACANASLSIAVWHKLLDFVSAFPYIASSILIPRNSNLDPLIRVGCIRDLFSLLFVYMGRLCESHTCLQAHIHMLISLVRAFFRSTPITSQPLNYAGWLWPDLLSCANVALLPLSNATYMHILASSMLTYHVTAFNVWWIFSILCF